MMFASNSGPGKKKARNLPVEDGAEGDANSEDPQPSPDLNQFVCALCTFKGYCRSSLNEHIMEKHPDLGLSIKKLEFDSMEDFDIYKCALESVQPSYFTCETDTRKHSYGSYGTYKCSRECTSNSLGVYEEKHCDIPTCSAFIKVRASKYGRVRVDVVDVHLHECDSAKLPLNSLQQKILHTWFSQGIGNERILELCEEMGPNDRMFYIDDTYVQLKRKEFLDICRRKTENVAMNTSSRSTLGTSVVSLHPQGSGSNKNGSHKGASGANSAVEALRMSDIKEEIGDSVEPAVGDLISALNSHVKRKAEAAENAEMPVLSPSIDCVGTIDNTMGGNVKEEPSDSNSMEFVDDINPDVAPRHGSRVQLRLSRHFAPPIPVPSKLAVRHDNLCNPGVSGYRPTGRTHDGMLQTVEKKENEAYLLPSVSFPASETAVRSCSVQSWKRTKVESGLIAIVDGNVKEDGRILDGTNIVTGVSSYETHIDAACELAYDDNHVNCEPGVSGYPETTPNRVTLTAKMNGAYAERLVYAAKGRERSVNGYRPPGRVDNLFTFDMVPETNYLQVVEKKETDYLLPHVNSLTSETSETKDETMKTWKLTRVEPGVIAAREKSQSEIPRPRPTTEVTGVIRVTHERKPHMTNQNITRKVIKPSALPAVLRGSGLSVVKFLPYARPTTTQK